MFYADTELAPDIGVGDDVAHFYFVQLVDGMVCSTFCTRDDRSANVMSRATSITKESVIGI